MVLYQILLLNMIILAVTTLSAVESSQATQKPQITKAQQAANEGAAKAMLKAVIFPAQIMFHAGAYLDVDQDKRGEFAPDLATLAGGKCEGINVSEGELELLDTNFLKKEPKNGYIFHMMPHSDAEKYFTVLAVPASPESGTRVFALNQIGKIYATTYQLGAIYTPELVWADDQYQSPAPGWVKD